MGLISQLSYRRPQALEKRRAHSKDNRNSILLSETKFSAVLRRERRRTERSRRPFLLMLAAMETISPTENGTAFLEDLASALAASSRETDIIGWHRQDEVLGAIFTELGTAEKNAIVASVRQKPSVVLSQKLIKSDSRKVALEFHFFPEDSTQQPHSEPRMHGELYRDQQSKIVARGIKRVIDVLGSALALIIFSPIFLWISLVIRFTSAGPALFRQKRIGQHGKEFTFLKFRSMYVNNDATLHQEYVSHFIAGKAPMKESADRKTSAYKVIDDPRVTSFGRFLRKTSLDELPQLMNVLKGEMSLVGPRPPLPYEVASYDLWHRRRIIEVKPGITGLWQVCGRSRTSFDEMVRLDLRYARRWSLLLDFRILLKTPRAVLSGDGAY